MTTDDTLAHLHTDEDLERARANPLLTLGLDNPYEGMFRISFTNGDIMALHVRGDDTARSTATEVTRLCRYDWALERFSTAEGWTGVEPA